MKHPVIDLKHFEYVKQFKQLRIPSEFCGFPSSFSVRSHHTGKVVDFVPLDQNDADWNEDGWDGEIAVYKPTKPVPGVQRAVFYHAW